VDDVDGVDDVDEAPHDIPQMWYPVPSETSERLWPVAGKPHTVVVVRLDADTPGPAMIAVPDSVVMVHSPPTAITLSTR